MSVRRTSTSTWCAIVARSLAVLLVLAFALHRALPRAVAQESVTWQRYDVTLDLREDGSYHVSEEQEIDFAGGPFSGGFATIPLDRIDAIEGIALSELDGSTKRPYEFVEWDEFDESPRTYSYRENASEIEINWGFPSTSDASRTFVLEYDAVGALRIYGAEPDVRQQIWWTAISTDVTEIAPVIDASVTINLPRPIDPAAALLGVDAEEKASDHTNDGQTWTWSKRNLRSGDDFLVRLEFPKLVDAAVPSWQAEDDESHLEEEKDEDRLSLIRVIVLAFTLLLTATGGISLFGLWYSRGRDPHVGAVAEFLPTPPDDLPPGAAGALIDEVAHERDVVATVVDLGRRGVMKIDEQTEGGLGGRDFALTLTQGDAPMVGFEQSLVRSLFPGETKETKLSSAKPGFTRSAGTIKDQLYDELVTRGYFAKSPKVTRAEWSRASNAGLIAIIVASLVFAITGWGDRIILVPLVVSGLLALALRWLSARLPQKTVKGAEASAKWLAFKRYLGDIEKYDKLAESQTIFDKYLPYAVAFGLEHSWVRKFAAAGAAPPEWYGPVILSGPRDWSDQPRHRRTTGGGTWVYPTGSGGSSPSGGDGGDGGNFDMPTLQEMSDRAGGSIQSGSNSFFDLLSSAAEAFADFSSSSGGGGGRKHWGGSGGGFRGGGSRGGSSGGGKRGFH